jgi:hypothetical protein
MNSDKYYNIINKEGDKITFPEGFPKLQTNGNYHIVHNHTDNMALIKENKINILLTWLTNTFPNYGNNNDNSNDDIINKAHNIYKSDNRQNFIDIIKWLNDPNDN